MAVHSVERVQVICDRCQVPALERGGMIRLWPSAEDAVEELVRQGWSTAGGGQLVCAGCSAAITCANQGHVWDPWRMIAPHLASRFCHRCSCREQQDLSPGSPA